MKRIAILLVLCMAVGLLGAVAVQAADKTHDMKAEIVSIDLKAHTLTIKDDKEGTKTVPVLANAQDSMKMFKAGDKVMLSCMDNEKGEHQGVSAIKAMPVAAHKPS